KINRAPGHISCPDSLSLLLGGVVSKPLCCQVVFGPERRLRAWFILKDGRIYVDPAGGDSSQTCERPRQQPAKFPFELADPDGRTKYKITSAPAPQHENDRYMVLSVDICGPVGYGQYGTVQLAEDPQQAGLAHIHGPLAVQLVARRADQPPLSFITGKPRYLQAVITTHLPERGSWIAVYSERSEPSFPPGLVPMADVEFLPKVAGEAPIHRQFALGEFC